MSLTGTTRHLAEVLSRSTLFTGWAPDALADVALHFTATSVSAGVAVCVEGQSGDEMYVVEQGRFRVEATVGQRRLQLAVLGPGAVFGEMALVTGQPRTATVTAETDARLWALHRPDLYELARRYPALRASLDRLVSERAGDTERMRLSNERQTLFSLPSSPRPITIGRDATNDIVLADPRVSRNHAEIRPVGQEYELVDLGSTNGTYVNGQLVTKRILWEGDEIWISGSSILFDRSTLTRYSRGGGIQVDAVGLRRVVGKGITILDDVSLSIYPGELVCIVGGSGAGKTTLLSALNGLHTPTTGQVLYSGADFYQHFNVYRQSLGYVPQDDIVHVELSIYQTLYYAARLRLPGDTSAAEIEERIADVLQTLGLTERRDTEVRRLSGGQRKRVSIGVELLTKPDVFYLDEPTSGLDPGLDKRMMNFLRTLANQGRTVVATTHATRNIMICDKIVFMARGGLLAFYGSPHDALGYFGVEEFADIYEILEVPGAGEEWRQRFRQSELYERNITQRLQQPTGAPSAVGAGGQQRPSEGDLTTLPASALKAQKTQRSPGPGWTSQLFWLSARYLRILRADPVALGMLVAAAPIIGLIVSSTFSRDVFAMSWDDGGDARQAIAMLFMVASGCLFLGSFVATRSIAEEVPIYARERLINLKIVPYVLSKIWTLALFGLLQAALLLGVVAFRIDFPGGTETLLKLGGALALTAIASVGLGLFISSLAGNGLQATLILVVLLIPQLAISGAIVPLSQVDFVARALSYAMIGRWSLSMLGNLTQVNERIDAQYPKNDFVDQFNIDPALCALAIVGLFLAFITIASIALKRRDVR